MTNANDFANFTDALALGDWGCAIGYIVAWHKTNPALLGNAHIALDALARNNPSNLVVQTLHNVTHQMLC